MFTSLEGMARDNTKMIDENGDLHITRILDGLDSLYGVSMTFQSLNMALCSLQQKPMESAHAYYNCMAQITVILREYHGNRYRPGELARMSKDCFYAGLLPENCPMVVHLKDQPHTTPLDLLRALLEQEENDTLTHTRYPLSTSARLTHPLKPAERYHRQPPDDKRNDGYTVRSAQLDTAPAEVVPEIDPHCWATQWTASRCGTMMDSSLVSAKPLRLANTGVVAASTVRRRATVGTNARKPFTQSSRSCPTDRIENRMKERRRL